MRPGYPELQTVSAWFDNGRWYCQDPDFFQVLQNVRLPEDYYPDEDLALVNYVARLYSGKVTDLRGEQPAAQGDEVY
jgi:hypothetical protein